MKASYYVSEGKFDIRDVNAVEPQADEVMLRMAYCGICGTDMHIFHGKMDKRVNPPQVIGHEASAVVEKVGSAVTRFAPGDRVVVRPLDWCSNCPACEAGHSHICMNLKFMVRCNGKSYLHKKQRKATAIGFVRLVVKDMIP